jgi:hypothetical protein
MTWKIGFEMYLSGKKRPDTLMAQKGWDDAKFGHLPNGSLPVIDRAIPYEGPKNLDRAVELGYAQ